MTEVAIRSARAGDYARLLQDQGIDVVESAEILLADPTEVRGDLAGVRWIQSTWAGVDAIDWSAVPDGAVVTSLPGVFGPQMIEFVFGHLLARTQRVVERWAARTWDETPPGALRGSALGVLGAGSIGGAIGSAGRMFGMTVVGCRRSGGSAPSFHRIHPVEEIVEFAHGLHHLIVVLPATPETAGLVDAEVLDRLAPGASLVNVGRGSTVDIDSVIRAVRSGQVGKAILDTTDPEPLPSDHPAWGERDIVVTGHTAAVSIPEDIVRFFLSNLARHSAGEALAGVVRRDRGY